MSHYNFFFNIPIICCLKYFRAKFREILTSGSRQIGVFLRKKLQYSAFNRNFLTNYACTAFNWLLSMTKNLRIAEFFAS